MEKYNVTGMSCAACSARVEKAVKSCDGVTECNVNLLTNSMTVEGGDSEKIIKAVKKAGYGAQKADGGTKNTKSEEIDETKPMKKRLFVSLGFLLVLMYFSMGHMFNLPQIEFFENNYIAVGIAEMLLAGIIMVINQKFFVSGVKGVLNGAPNMDTLVSLGATASFVYSVAVLFVMTASENAAEWAHGFYFESAGMILTLITLGKLLEAYSKGKTTNAVKGLMALKPKSARVIRNGEEVSVSIEDVKVGDVFTVRPGESIPVDAVVTEGESAVDESALTGESVPSDKKAGDGVSAATINKSGFLKCRATRVGEETTLSQIIKMVEDASATKAPIAKIADKVSGVFVPVVMSIAAITFVIWMILGKDIGFSLARAISVLVISCPCALGLATPVAIMVGSGVGAKNGILFKTALSLEKTGKADIVVLDKTGTVTKGEPAVTDVYEFDEKLMEYAYSLEAKSEHPLAKAVVKKAEELKSVKYECEKFEALPGNGLCGFVNGEEVFGGSGAFIATKVNLSQEVQKNLAMLSDSGKTPLLFAKSNKLMGIIAVADMIKEDSPKAVEELKNMGITTVMLTGDNHRTAKAVAKKAGIEKVYADTMPDQKAKIVEELKKEGKVIMVGDGINDAPALTVADTGIAIGNGVDVAIDAADVVLMNSSILSVPMAIRLSRQTLKNIKENLFWAFIYNIIGIPLAAGVYINLLGWELNPMFGAAAMSMSSVCVVTNALRLNFFNVRSTKKDVAKKKRTGNGQKEFDVEIDGMMCSHCENTVKEIIEKTGGNVIKVSAEENKAVFEASGKFNMKKFEAAIKKAGFKVK